MWRSLLKKAQAFQKQMQDDELSPFIQECITAHQTHLQQLIDLVRKHNGKGGMTQ
jgi:hypothetical protein